MSVETTDVVLLILLLQIKHMIADFFLQNSYMIENRRYYGHPGGLLHVAIHLVGTLTVLLVMGTAALTILGILVAEGVFHYHLDWSKDNFVASRQLTPRDAVYWYAMGVDQALHQASYLAIAVWWALA